MCMSVRQAEFVFYRRDQDVQSGRDADDVIGENLHPVGYLPSQSKERKVGEQVRDQRCNP